MKKYPFLIIFITIIPTLYAQKKVMLIPPKSESFKESLYEPIRNSLDADSKIEIDERISMATWKDFKDNHEKKDPGSVKDRKDLFQGSGISYYILITQEPEDAAKETFKNTVALYYDKGKFVISWTSKKYGQHYKALLKFNLGKIKYCINNNVEKKDLVLIKTTNNIRDENWRDKYKHFGIYFKGAVESEDEEVTSKYSFNPILNTNSIEPKATYITYDISLDITLSGKDEFVTVEILLTDYSGEVSIPIFEKQYSHNKKLGLLCSRVVKDFLELNKAWLLKDHSL